MRNAENPSRGSHIEHSWSWKRQRSRNEIQHVSKLLQQLSCCDSATSTHSIPYFVTKCLVGATVLSGAAGEIENVNQVFQPDGRFAASNSP